MARFSLSTSHQRVLSVVDLGLNFPRFSVAGDDGCGGGRCVDRDDLLVGDERLDEANRLPVAVAVD